MYDHPTTVDYDFVQTFYVGDWRNMSYNIIVERNLLYDLPEHQVFGNISDDDNPTNFHDWTFRNNVVYNVGYQGNFGVPNVKFYNNTFYYCNWQNGFGPLNIINQNGWGHCTNYACGNDNDDGWYGGTGTQPADGFIADYNYVLKSNYGSMSRFSEAHGINGGNPYFLNFPNRDFHLTSNSPAKDTGVNLSLTGFSNDKDGVSRPQGSSWDIGAYEYYEYGDSLHPNPPGNLRIIN
jgi:hypothetical protein